MRIAQVHIQVKPDCLDAFIEATARNADASRSESGVLQFDVLQSEDDPTCFILFEIYTSSDAQAAHKQTAHFERWKSDVQDLIVAPGRAALYRYAIDPA